MRKERNRERGRRENGRENPSNKRRKTYMVRQGQGGGDEAPARKDDQQEDQKMERTKGVKRQLDIRKLFRELIFNPGEEEDREIKLENIQEVPYISGTILDAKKEN